jgi:hypothetical protein
MVGEENHSSPHTDHKEGQKTEQAQQEKPWRPQSKQQSAKIQLDAPQNIHLGSPPVFCIPCFRAAFEGRGRR